MSKETYDAISVDLIDAPERELRSVMIREKLDELVESIRMIGIIQPLRLARKGERYEVICGHRRLMAAKALGLATVPAIVAESTSEIALVEAVHENLVREDVNAIDLARCLREVKREKNLTNSEVSALFGKSHGWAGQYMVLLNCDGGIQAAVAAGQLDIISARRLQSIEDDNTRHVLLTHAVRSGASQATIGGWVSREKAREDGGFSDGVLPDDGDPPAEPEALVFTCRWCGESNASEEMITMPFCSRCYQDYIHAMKLEAAQAESGTAIEENNEKK